MTWRHMSFDHEPQRKLHITKSCLSPKEMTQRRALSKHQILTPRIIPVSEDSLKAEAKSPSFATGSGPDI